MAPFRKHAVEWWTALEQGTVWDGTNEADVSPTDRRGFTFYVLSSAILLRCAYATRRPTKYKNQIL